MRSTQLFLIGLLSFAGTTLSGAPQYLELANGDRIAGSLIEIQDGNIIFESESFGKLTTPVTGAKVIDSDGNPIALIEPPKPAPKKRGG